MFRAIGVREANPMTYLAFDDHAPRSQDPLKRRR